MLRASLLSLLRVLLCSEQHFHSFHIKVCNSRLGPLESAGGGGRGQLQATGLLHYFFFSTSFTRKSSRLIPQHAHRFVPPSKVAVLARIALLPRWHMTWFR